MNACRTVESECVVSLGSSVDHAISAVICEIDCC